MPNTAFNGVQWPNDPNTIYRQYHAADVSMVDGVNVFEGDTAGYSTFALTPSLLAAADGIHPANQANNTILANLWGVAFMHRFGPVGQRWSHA
jgi:hypothetical protein